MIVTCITSAIFAQEGLTMYTKMVGDKQKYGIADSKGNALTPAKYDWIGDRYHDGLILAYIAELRSVDNSNNPFAAVKTGHYWAHMHGYIDTKGKEVIPFKYWDAKAFSDGYAQVTNNGRLWAMIDKQGRELTPFKYSEIREDYDNIGKPVRVYVIEEGYKKNLGLISTSGKQLTSAIYDKINPFYEDVAVMNRNNLMGVLDMRGVEIAAPQYNNLDEYKFVNGLCRVQRKDKWGFIDRAGLEVVPVIYDRVYLFDKDGSAKVRQGTGVGRIDRNGKVLVPLKYDNVEPLSDGMYKVVLAKKYGWNDQSGKQVIDPTYDYASSFVGGYAYARLNGKYGVINKNNEVKVPFQYEDIGRTIDDEPLLFFKRQGRFGFLSETLTEITPPKYTRVFATKKQYGYGYVQVDNKWGMVDLKGRESIEPKYDTLVMQETDVVAVLNRKVGILTAHGSVIVPIKYDDIYGFSDGLCMVLLNNKIGFVNREGKEVIPLQFDEASDFERGRAQVRLGNQIYFIDKTGKKIE